MNTLKTKSLTWHHFFKPSKEDIDWVIENYNFHELVTTELTKPTARPKSEAYDHYIYMVLHFPIYDEVEKKIYEREVDFLITKKDLITVTYDHIRPLEEFFKLCSIEKSCEDLYGSQTPAHLVFYIVKNLYSFLLRQLDHIHRNVTKLEDKIFSGKGESVIEELSAARRDIIYFRRALKPHHITLDSLKEHGEVLFGKAIIPYLTGLTGEYLKVWSLLENNKEALDALYENNTAMISLKQNQIMKMFTILAFVTFPLSLLVSILQVDPENNPIHGKINMFWFITGTVFFGTVFMLWIFRKKHWI